MKNVVKKVYRRKTFVKFFISGGTSAVVNFSLLWFFHGVLKVNVVVSVVIAVSAAILVNFNLQKFWAFRDKDKGKTRRQMILFFSVSLAGLGLNVIAIYIMVEIYGIHYILAQVIIGAVLAVSNFLFYKFLIFKRPEEEAGAAAPAQKKLHLLIATGIYPPDIGGPATYVSILRKELPNHEIDVRVVTYSDKTESSESNVSRVSRRGAVLARYYRYFQEIEDHMDWADLVFAQGPISEGIPAGLACWLCDKPYFLKVVGDYAWEQAKQKYAVKDMLDDFLAKKYSGPVARLRWLERKVAQGAMKVITPSEYLRRVVSAWGVDKEKIEVIYNAVCPALINNGRQALREQLELKGDVIVSAGRLVPWKGFLTLIELMPVLWQANPDFRLVIIGGGPLIAELREIVAEKDLGTKIIITGSLPQEDLWNYLKASDMFVLNTGYEGLPHLVIEAMQLGVPVITTNVGGNAEVIKNNHNGILVEYDNKEELASAIVRLHKDSNLRQAITDNAYESLSKFTRERMIAGIVKLIKDESINLGL